MSYRKRYWGGKLLGALILTVIAPTLLYVFVFQIIAADWSFIDFTILGSVIAVVLGGVVASIVKTVGEVIVQNRTVDTETIEQKAVLYAPIVALLIEVMSSKDRSDGKQLHERIIAVFNAAVMLRCSNKIIRYLYYIRDYADRNESEMEMFYRYEALLFAIREDMGIRGSLDQGDILALLQKESKRHLRRRRFQ